MARGRLLEFLNDESGATAIEYGLLAALIAMAIIGSFTMLGNSLFSLFNQQTANIIAERTALIP